MRLTKENTALWIVNYKRPEAVRQTVQYWLNSFDFEEVNIMANHSSICLEWFPEEIRHKIKIHYNWLRPDWMAGSLAQCWNTAILHSLVDKEWVVLSQDDVDILPGWADCINNSIYDYYLCPVGDTCQILSLEGFKKIGWFDERFRALGGPEADYELRAIRNCPDNISIWDEHCWQMRHNTVGLEKYIFLSIRTSEVLETRNTHNLTYANAECFDRWNQKWGKHVDTLFYERDYYRDVNPGWDEIDWYPSWTRYMQGLGRL